MSERDNALIFCLCVISCTILFAAATIIKLLNQKRRVRYVRVELDTPQTPPLEEQAPKQPHVSKLSTSVDSGSISDTNQDNLPVESTSQDGNQEVTQNATGTESVRSGSGIVASNRRSSSEDSLFESKPERKSSESSHPSNPITGELKDSLKNDENSSEKEISSKPKPSLDIISSLKKNLHDFRDGLDSNSRSIEVPKRDSPSMEAETDDGTQGERTSDKESVRSRSGSASSNGSHKIEDDSTGPKSSHSKPIDTMHQHSSKRNEDSSEDDDTSHSPRTGGETTPDPKSDRSRSESDDSNRNETSEDKSTGPKSSLQEPIDTMHQNSSKRDEDSPEDDYVFSSSHNMCSIL